MHLTTRAACDDLATLHHQVVVGQLLGKVVILLAQQDGHALAVQAGVGQHAQHAANVFDDAGLDALGGLVQHQQFGASGQGAGNGQLLLLPARQVTAPAVQHLSEHRKQLVQLRWHRRGGDLSGGQQQQLAIARALAPGPKLLILDEPTEGIQPSIIKDIGRVIRMLADRGTMAIVLCEQYYDFAEELADEYIVMERGEVIASGKGADMQANGVRKLVAI